MRIDFLSEFAMVEVTIVERCRGLRQLSPRDICMVYSLWISVMSGVIYDCCASNLTWRYICATEKMSIPRRQRIFLVLLSRQPAFAFFLQRDIAGSS
ncbi:hypothetical protein Y032_0010g1009 [Ancylostoma ceylanicum]|uniref:Uncharacterized protein n=1 Tax=Ancylostoma ceylanicum TaxID=53326 RepID=A0A016VGP5_9BILA|nr:hypothetical protein Y032_0010g1009 [Ancylostoma ceylanicum]